MKQQEKRSMHITTALKILDAREAVDMKVWKKDGGIMVLKNAQCTSFDFRQGTRRMRCLDSNEIRMIRDSFIFEINNTEVYL